MKKVWVLWSVNVGTDPYTFEVIRVYREADVEKASADKVMLESCGSNRRYYVDRHDVVK